MVVVLSCLKVTLHRGFEAERAKLARSRSPDLARNGPVCSKVAALGSFGASVAHPGMLVAGVGGKAAGYASTITSRA